MSSPAPEGRPKTSGIILTAFLLSTALAPAAVARTQSPATQTFVTMISEGEYIGQGVHRLFYPGNASVTIGGSASYVWIDVSGGTRGDYYTLEFAAPPGERLRPGLYDHAQRAAFRESGRPGIDISGSGRGCNEVGGRFDVKDIGVAADGVVNRLWLTYEHHCENGPLALFGEVRYRAATANSDLLLAPGAVWWPDVEAGGSGSTVPIWIIGQSPSPVTITASSVRGRHRADFPIRLDECTGITLSLDEMCQLFVRFVPTGNGPRVARLVIEGDAAHRHVVPLDASVLGGVTRFTIRSDPGDWIGQGRDWEYGPHNAVFSVSGGRSYVFAAIDGANGDWWYADFVAPAGDILVPGETYTARRYPFQGTGAGMDVSGEGRGCNTLTGTFTVLGISIDPRTDSLNHVGIRYEQHCEGGEPAARGVLKYRFPTGDTTAPGPVDNVQLTRDGSTATVTWRNPSASDLAFVMVRYLHGDTAAGVPNSWLFAAANTRGRARIGNVPAARPLTVALYPVDQNGNVGRRVVRTA